MSCDAKLKYPSGRGGEGGVGGVEDLYKFLNFLKFAASLLLRNISRIVLSFLFSELYIHTSTRTEICLHFTLYYQMFLLSFTLGFLGVCWKQVGYNSDDTFKCNCTTKCSLC